MMHRISHDLMVFACNHISEALTILHNEYPALMMMDIEMPEMNGMEMIRHINHSGMKVIAMTAHDGSIKEKLLQAGFDDCLFKPITMEGLSSIFPTGEQVFLYKENRNRRLDSILAFAGDDPEDARKILQTVKQELETYISSLTEVQKSEPLSTEKLAKTVHKLQPLATMLQLESIEKFKYLSPEYIQETAEEDVRKYLQAIISNLQDILGEI
jgi:CheY-like chemotaxis protein